MVALSKHRANGQSNRSSFQDKVQHTEVALLLLYLNNFFPDTLLPLLCENGKNVGSRRRQTNSFYSLFSKSLFALHVDGKQACIHSIVVLDPLCSSQFLSRRVGNRFRVVQFRARRSHVWW